MNFNRMIRVVLPMVMLSAFLGACGAFSPEPTPTPTPIPPTATPVPPTDTPLPTATDTPIPTDTPEPFADLFGKVIWLETGDPIIARVYLSGGGASKNVASGTAGDYSFSTLNPGTYTIVTELMFDNPIFDPCGSMTFSADVPDWKYSMMIMDGEMKGIKGTFESITLEAGDAFELEIPFSFTCN